MVAQAGYYWNGTSQTLILVPAGASIPTSWKYMGLTNVFGWPTINYIDPSAPPLLTTSGTTMNTVSTTTSQVVPVISNQPSISQNISDGSTFITPSGAYVQTSTSGSPLPDGWTRTSEIPAGQAVIVDPLVGTGISADGGVARVSTGGNYQTPEGNVVSMPSGSGIPASWIDLSVRPDIDITGKDIIQAPDAAAVVANYKAMQTLSLIAGAVGIGGLIWLGSSIIFDPEGAAKILSRINDVKTLLVDSGTIMAVVIGLAGVGFLSYEFASAYVRNNYDIAATMADLLSSFLVTILSAVVDSVVDFCKKVASAISDAIF